LVILCITGSHLKEKFKKGWWGNSSSKAFGVSIADKTKAKKLPKKCKTLFTHHATLTQVKKGRKRRMRRKGIINGISGEWVSELAKAEFKFCALFKFQGAVPRGTTC
jgi:hypothetical protein